jgi:STE24 endopeptidase
MNLYAVMALATLLVPYLLNVLADVLNLRALRPELPLEFQGIYDHRAYRESLEYARVLTQFDWFTSTFRLIMTLGFWFAGGFGALDLVVRNWPLGPLWTGLAYIGILVLAGLLLSIPFDVYSTFVLEERFRFNRTTPATFVTDRLKGLALVVILGGPLVAGSLVLLTYAGVYSWLYCWIGAAVWIVGVQFIAPTWILPLFNTYRPLETGPVKNALLAYARSVNFPLEDVMVMDGSRRSGKSSAFLIGFGERKRIVLFDTLITLLTPPELVAVLAHEVGHDKKMHVLQGMALNIAQIGVMFFLLSVFLNHRGLFQAFYVEQPTVYTGLALFGLLYVPMNFLISIGIRIIFRTFEYEADRFAIETIESAEAMVQAMKKVWMQNLSKLTPHPFHVFLNDSHPPILARLEAIRRVSARRTSPIGSSAESFWVK